MKTYNATKRISPQLKRRIKKTIETNDQYSGCYFWTQTGNASSRRAREKRFSRDNPEYRILTKKGTVEVLPSLNISCKNFYYRLEIQFSGNKSNISRLKNMMGV